MFFFCHYVDPRRKYQVKLLAFSTHGDGYQAHQIVSTPGCPCKSTWKICVKVTLSPIVNENKTTDLIILNSFGSRKTLYFLYQKVILCFNQLLFCLL